MNQALLPPKTWILIRGLVREAAHWGDFVRILGEKFPHDKILCLDAPGVGARRNERSPTRLSDITDELRSDARSVLGPLELHRPILLSISLGSMIGVDWVTRYPFEISNFVLINPSFRGMSPFYHRFRPEEWPRLFRAVFARDPLVIERNVLDITSNRPLVRERNLEIWARVQRERPVSRRTLVAQCLAAIRFKAPKQIPVNVRSLLLSSAGDRLADPRCSDRISERWKIPMRRHPNAGHDLALDEGAWVLEQIRSWL